ncbi:DNA polymerase IV [Candidatus Woesebacteria bacterium]|nr:DNA polymerase IV [Candidatus Woesebacteria bacterium]
MKYKGNVTDLGFNKAPSTTMHIDFNSCFATIEQQANPLLRGKPIAVAAYTTPSGCIVAPSVEAKKLGIKVGMRVKDGKAICPELVVLEPDPWKYRDVHLKLRKLISRYTSDFAPRSIDEFVLNMEGYLHLHKSNTAKMLNSNGQGLPLSKYVMHSVAKEIKQKIKSEIGEWLTVSVGIAPNRFLAKTAAGLNKPDGLDEINCKNFRSIYSNLKLTDLCGIKFKNTARLNSVGIYTVNDFYDAPLWKIKAAFQSINGYYWYVRLHGWEIDDIEFGRRSYGNSYALPKPLKTPQELSPILTKLVEKMGFRLRRAGLKAKGIHLSVMYRDWSYWHKAVTFEKELFDSREIYKKVFTILCRSSLKKPVRELAVSVFDLRDSDSVQLELFEDVVKKEKLVNSIDKTNERWGNYMITPARMLYADKTVVPDRIAFGGVKELEEFTLDNTNIQMNTNDTNVY